MASFHVHGEKAEIHFFARNLPSIVHDLLRRHSATVGALEETVGFNQVFRKVDGPSLIGFRVHDEAGQGLEVVSASDQFVGQVCQ